MSSADARNESEELRQELARVDGQWKEVEAAVASQQRLGETVVQLQNEAAGESFYRAIPFFGFFPDNCKNE